MGELLLVMNAIELTAVLFLLGRLHPAGVAYTDGAARLPRCRPSHGTLVRPLRQCSGRTQSTG